MATLALGLVGGAIGGAVLPSVSLFGATLTGAAIGQGIGALAGSVIDQALFGASGQSRLVQGPRLSDLRITASTEGQPVPRLYGRMRLAGQLIWATRFEEEEVKTREGGGGKGLSGGAGGETKRVDYRYFANVAYAVCEGEIARVGRLWADGKELDQSGFTTRVYSGSETQEPDSLIAAKEGADEAPAYRGVAYVVFEHMPIAHFGNRLPQLNFEVFRPVDRFEKALKAVDLIPAAGEFAYAPEKVVRSEFGVTIPENVHTGQGGSDWATALDQLEQQLPNVRKVALVVTWFGGDLRIGQCTLRPGVEVSAKATTPLTWSVAGVSRDDAYVVSRVDGAPAFGGTPTDASVVAAIKDLNARGFDVCFYPFILMDVAAGNALPDPYTGAIGQPVYPWRGRITCDPAPGRSGTPDKTSGVTSQIASFVGAAAPSDYAVAGETVSYSGPAEWTLRRMVLHYASLCEAAGGVEAFIVASELRGATWLRSGPSTYPFVPALAALAADVKSIVGGGTKVLYAADWSEYFGHQPQDGSGDVHFHLDPLWSSAAIDAIGIDCYWPLSDWRDGEGHRDRLDGTRSIYDLDYLKRNVFGGEGYDWFYASPTDREAQIRSPITDGAGKPWVFRYKDIRNWWSNLHHDRPGGAEQATPTAWQPQSKPIWLTEIGCPAIDKGANQPNVFIDPKSSESLAPYFSNRVRDDFMQRRYLQAFHEVFDPEHEDFDEASNPVSSVYAGRMLDPERLYVYCWDARPYPAFPFAADVWTDAGNWQFGHWISGRVGAGPIGAVVSKILDDYGFARYGAARLYGQLDGYVLDRIMSARQALQSLELAFFFDSYESDGLIQFRHRGIDGPLATLALDDLVETAADADLATLTRGQETELPLSAKLAYIESDADYRQAAVEARRLSVRSQRVAASELAIALPQAQAQAIAESWLQEAWASRDRAKFALPPSRIGLEPTDVVRLQSGGRDTALRITETGDAEHKTIDALSIDPGVFLATATPPRRLPPNMPSVFGRSVAAFLDLPLLRGDEAPHTGWIAAWQQPWPGAVAFYRSPGAAGFTLHGRAGARAAIGSTMNDLYPGPEGRFDEGNALDVALLNGELASLETLALLDGGNAAAIENADGEWEVVQFRNADLIAPNAYRLRGLLRGQAGTEGAMRAPVAAGARFVLLDAAVSQVDMTRDEIGLPFNWKYGPANRDIADASYSERVHAFVGLGLRPLSPVHLRGRRDPASNDLALSWVRRTRIGGDGWEQAEVPLGEESEAYEVDILDGPAIKRTLSSATPSAIYPASAQIADFGSVQPSYAVRVHQLSASHGRGAGRTASLP